MARVAFEAIPGTVGRIQEDGRELVCHADEKTLAKVRKFCTVKDKGAEWQYKRAMASLANVEEKLEDPDISTRQSQSLAAAAEKLRAEIAEIKPRIIREYWADKASGGLSLPPGFHFLMEKCHGHINDQFSVTDLPVIDGRTSRDFQIETARELLKYYRASCVLPTGTGKTQLTGILAKSLIARDLRVAVIVPTIELVDQTVKALKQYFPDITGLGGSHRFKLGASIMVTTINSALKHLDSFDSVVVDEAHHSAASTYNDTLLLAQNAKYFYGLTACPVRADGLSLGIHAATGPVVCEKTTQWAIESGWLCDLKIGMIEVNVGRVNPNQNAQLAYKKLTTHPNTCKVMYELLQKAIDADRPTLVLFKTVGAGEVFKEYCAKRGLEFDVASSEWRKPLQDFRNCKTKFLVSNFALTGEGVDIPNISVVINACQGSSEQGVRQSIGRGLRPAPGKEYLSVFDITTSGYGQFEGAKRNRLAIYQTITSNIKEIYK